MDGTFDQDRQRLRVQEATQGMNPCFSFDMSACTDRLPVDFQSTALYLCKALTRNQSSSWSKVCTNRDFVYEISNKRKAFVRYAVGQPMGLLSS